MHFVIIKDKLSDNVEVKLGWQTKDKIKTALTWTATVAITITAISAYRNVKTKPEDSER